ncbi:uncharacterized protein YALI1_E40274g [Yarrowia lipolytica]|uniref:Uncharacterized protein n=1 Tax=Yarrowia lipolytica TaxID=4952 RepID=A0A1D8NL45_YARLL|nr:hypothetical protein YALI1_E40274g [Yarrowia lipolytica]
MAVPPVISVTMPWLSTGDLDHALSTLTITNSKLVPISAQEKDHFRDALTTQYSPDNLDSKSSKRPNRTNPLNNP